MRPPVSVRILPPRSALGVLSRFAFWPLAWIGARALPLGDARFVAFGLVLASLVASSLTRAKRRWLGAVGVALGAGAVAVASFGAARSALAGAGAPTVLAYALGLAGALLAARWFVRTLVLVRAFEAPALDADALALAPVAAWLGLCAALTRFGAEGSHVHAIAPTIATVEAALGCALGALGTVVLARQRAWIARAYQGLLPPLALEASAADAPALSHVEAADLAIASTDRAPYREHRAPVASVPRDPAALDERYRRRARATALATLGAALVLVAGLRAEASHAAEGAFIPAALPPFPGACASAPPRLRLVPLEPLITLDLAAVAERYRGLGVQVQLDPPLRFDPSLVDASRGQLVGEAVLRAAKVGRPPAGPGELVLVVTDRDLYPRELGWRFAFALRDRELGVVSVARMDPAFPLFSPRDYVPTRASCSVELRARAYKMITRALLTTACGAPPRFDPGSVLSVSVMGLGDLDGVREDRF